MEEGVGFCSGCGKAINTGEMRTENRVAAIIREQNNKRLIMVALLLGAVVIAALALVILLFINNGGGGSGLSGTWANSNSIIDDEFAATIQFSGNRFTITEHYVWRDAQALGIFTITAGWELQEGTFFHDNRRFNFERDLRETSRRARGHVQYGGSYSISGDRIEFRFSDSDIVVTTFALTDNTLELQRTDRSGTVRLIRR